MKIPTHFLPNFLHREATATAATVLLGLAIAQTMPRGPATAAQALIVMITSLVVGYGAGWIMRSPWAMALAPLAKSIFWVNPGGRPWVCCDAARAGEAAD
ncbi:MAG: hypothetical protein HC824_22335 [Synechococcales cyanobacterium RM1_1_8]|nr:hypothetical protein [Synechococcales cyanobacterium RM1_1_8]